MADLSRCGRSHLQGPADPELKWKYPVNIQWSGRFIGIHANGNIYVQDSKKLSVIDRHGSLVWEFNNAPYRIASGGCHIDIDGTAYISNGINIITAIDPEGRMVEQYMFLTPYSLLAMTPEGLIIAPCNEGIVALDRHGAAKWILEGVDPAGEAAYSDEMLYVVVLRGAAPSLLAVSTEGEIAWEFPFPGDLLVGTTPAAADGVVYCNSRTTLYAVDGTGKKKWEYKAGPCEIRTSAVVRASGSVCVVAENGELHSVDSQGTREWVFKPAEQENGAGVAVDAKDTLFYGCGRKVCALAEDGSAVWDVKLDGDARIAPSIGYNRTLYISDGDFIYAFAEKH
jgi:outer membrane protein assembly factor BamB